MSKPEAELLLEFMARIPQERWGRIKLFPKYRISTAGRVASIQRIGPRDPKKPKVATQWRLLKPNINKRNGYAYVTLYDQEGLPKSRRLHRLVLETFVGPCPFNKEARHQNGRRADCRLSNLRWSSKSRNEKDKRRHGTVALGERNGWSKLTAREVTRMRQLYSKRGKEGLTLEQLGRQFGISTGHAWQVVNYKVWRHVPCPNPK